MPPKNCEFGSGTLCFSTGEMIGEIQKADLTMNEFAEDDETCVIIPPFKEATMTFKMQLRRNTVLSLIHGRKVTNNWLKMHGGVMSRRMLK